MSISAGCLPSSASRTLPPTRYAAMPRVRKNAAMRSVKDGAGVGAAAGAESSNPSVSRVVAVAVLFIVEKRGIFARG